MTATEQVAWDATFAETLPSMLCLASRSPVDFDESRGSAASSRVATLAGAAAVVAGGYRLVFRDSDWSRRKTLIFPVRQTRRRVN